MLLMPIRSETSAPPRTASKFTAAIGALIRIADPLILVGGALLAYRIRFGTWHLQKDYVSLVVITTLFGLLIFGFSSLYRSWRGRGLGAELMHLGLCWLLICTGVLFYTTLIQMIGELSRLWLGAWFGLSLAGAASIRIVLRGCASWARARGMDLRTAVIVGGNPDAQRIVDTLHRNPWMGIKVVGWFATSADRCALHGIRPMGRVDRLAAFVEARHIDQVWIALPMREQDQIAYVLRQLDFSTADIKLLPDLFGLQLLNHSVEQIGGLPVLNLRSSPLDGPAHLIKATMDKVLASLILLMISPLMIAIAIGVKLSSPGPVFFRQLRHGLGGKPIEVWKFRSMRVHQEEDGKVTQARKNDSRVTPFGAFLRRTSLDELPQFINVLQGSMSIVGPRPHAIAHNEQYKTLVDRYMQRHRVKPGITGWAQVNGLRGETDTVEKMARRVEYDLYYMQNWSPWFDLRIILMTVFKGFVNKNAY